MTDTNETVDLWGDIVTEPIRTPLTILKEQGAILERKTDGILTVQVSSQSPDSGRFQHFFSIKSANLNYSYNVFSVIHPIELYPLIFYSEVLLEKGGSNQRSADDEKEFLETLKEILQAPKTQKVIRSLLSQNVVA